MNKITIQALKSLAIPSFEWDREKKDLVEVEIHPTVIERDGKVLVSAEDGKGLADFYGEFRGGYPYIDPALESFAHNRGLYWEWENPGAIILVE